MGTTDPPASQTFRVVVFFLIAAPFFGFLWVMAYASVGGDIGSALLGNVLPYTLCLGFPAASLAGGFALARMLKGRKLSRGNQEFLERHENKLWIAIEVSAGVLLLLVVLWILLVLGV